MPGVAVVTDSTSDLDPGLRARFGIDVVPLFVNFGTTGYRDTVDISREDFYTKFATTGHFPWRKFRRISTSRSALCGFSRPI